MRLAITAALVFGALATRALPAPAQERPEIGGISVGGVPHPASAAIAYWDTLDLTEAQIQALRHVQARVEEVLSAEYERMVVDTAARLRYWRPGPTDSVAVVNEVRGQLEVHVRLGLAMLRARDETFRILSAEQRARLDSLVVGPLAFSPQATTHSACATGSPGGGARLSDRAELIFSLEYEGDSARIIGVVVAQADLELTSYPQPSHRFDSRIPHGGGGTSGRWWIVNDKESDAVWIDSTRVDRNGNNVVLVQGTDRVTRMPDVAGFASVPPRFYTGACRERDAIDALREHVLASPEVRAFLARPASPGGPGR